LSVVVDRVHLIMY